MSKVQSVTAPDGSTYITGSATTVYNNPDESFDEVLDKNTGTRTLEDIFRDVSEEYDVPLRLLKAVAQAESDFDTNAVSSCGASGIMQLMPKTAEGLGVEDVFDPEQNITGGAKMLAYLLDDYDGDTTLALAAYNAGSGAVAKYGGVPPYDETRNYIKKINDILEGGLEADLSYIQVNNRDKTTGTNQADALQSAQPASVRGMNIPVRIIDNNDISDDIFSYDDYLRFIEIYMKMLGTTIGEITDDENSWRTSQDESDDVMNEASEQQALYELERIKMSNRVEVLFQNK